MNISPLVNLCCVYNNTKEERERGEKIFLCLLLGMQIGRSPRRYFAHKNCESRRNVISFHCHVVRLDCVSVCMLNMRHLRFCMYSIKLYADKHTIEGKEGEEDFTRIVIKNI
jgi:hypothetical protein